MTELYRLATLVAGFAGILLAAIIAWRVAPSEFRAMRREIVAASALFWGALWFIAALELWDCCLGRVLAPWARWVLPVYGGLHGIAGLALWWLAARLSGNPALNFCLLGGLLAVPEHLWAIYGRRVLELVPHLQGVSAGSSLTFGVFEFILYWGITLCVALLFRQIRRRPGSGDVVALRRSFGRTGGAP